MTVTTNEYGQNNLFAKNPKWLLKATTARVLSPHSSMLRLQWSLGMMGIISGFISYAATGKFSSASSMQTVHGNFNWFADILYNNCNDGKLLLEILTYYVIGGALLIGAPGVFFLLYSCLPFKIRKGVWLDTKIIKPTVILQSMRTPVATITNFTYTRKCLTKKQKN